MQSSVFVIVTELFITRKRLRGNAVTEITRGSIPYAYGSDRSR